MIQKYLTLVLFFSVTMGVSSQQVIKLSDRWEFVKGDLGSVWEAIRYAPKGSPQAVPVWESVNLPHCYNAFDALDPDINYYEGPGWYRTFLSFDNPYKNGRILLHFEGAGQKTEVYIFTERVGSHVGGYDEWWVDITDAVKMNSQNPYLEKYYEGQIPLIIRTDNSRDVEMIPSDRTDFNLYGGLYRNVHVEYVPEIYIDQVLLTPVVSEQQEKGEVKVNILLKNFCEQTCSLVISIINSDGEAVYSTERTVANKEEILILEIDKPLLWSPLSPKLYSCIVKLQTPSGDQNVKKNFGFRSFEFVKHGPFILNGQRLLIKGMHRHEDHAGVGAAMTRKQIKKEMLMIKELGVNFIRLAHYQHSSQVLQLCDSLGILVWEEIPWCSGGGLGGERFKEQAKQMLQNMIVQHYNHPSIIIWGLGNETNSGGDFQEFDKGKVREFTKELNSLAHRLDPGRKTGIRVCDFCKDIVDVYSPSIWVGWYRKEQFTGYMKASQDEFEKVDHFFHMEWGVSSHAHRHSENPYAGLGNIITGKDEPDGDASLQEEQPRAYKDSDWSETYACNLIDWHLKEQEKMNWLTGTAYWIFKDYSSPLRPENPIPYVNQKGVVQRDLTPKELYYVFQSYWSEKPMVHIYGHTWPVRWGKKGEEKLLKVYSNCEKVELILNNQNLGIKKRDSQDFPAAALRWETIFNEGRNHVKVRAFQGNIIIEDSIDFIYETRQWGNPDKITYSVKLLNENESEVEVIVVDRNDVICLDSKNWIEFAYVGSGRMFGNLGIYGGSRKIQFANGRAVMHILHGNGQGVLHVYINGCKPLFIPINN